MPRKSYTQEEREIIRKQLITEGIRFLSKQGMKNTNLSQIYTACHISKSFFYSFFQSKEELCEAIIMAQQPHIIDLLRHCLKDHPEIKWRERIVLFMHTLGNSKNTGYFILTCEEHRMVRRKMSDEDVQRLRDSQIEYGRALMDLLEIPSERIHPHTFFNLYHSILLFNNSIAPEAPMLVAEQTQSTFDLQVEIFVDYVEKISQHREA